MYEKSVKTDQAKIKYAAIGKSLQDLHSIYYFPQLSYFYAGYLLEGYFSKHSKIELTYCIYMCIRHCTRVFCFGSI